jgi:hypothetical protein
VISEIKGLPAPPDYAVSNQGRYKYSLTAVKQIAGDGYSSSEAGKVK